MTNKLPAERALTLTRTVLWMWTAGLAVGWQEGARVLAAIGISMITLWVSNAAHAEAEKSLTVP